MISRSKAQATKIMWKLFFFCLVVLLFVLIVSLARTVPDEADLCEQQYRVDGKIGRLVEVLTIKPLNPRAYNGPWKCECI